jgi:hypothetical protein
MTRKLKTYIAEIYFVGEKQVKVKAKNERSAFTIAKRRVGKSNIGVKNVRIDMSDIHRFDSDY